jgi:hypothetical protein
VRTDGIRAALGGGTLTARGAVALDRVGQNAWTVNAAAWTAMRSARWCAA